MIIRFTRSRPSRERPVKPYFRECVMCVSAAHRTVQRNLRGRGGLGGIGWRRRVYRVSNRLSLLEEMKYQLFRHRYWNLEIIYNICALQMNLAPTQLQLRRCASHRWVELLFLFWIEIMYRWKNIIEKLLQKLLYK